MSNCAAAHNVMHLSHAYHSTRVCNAMALTQRRFTSTAHLLHKRACFGITAVGNVTVLHPLMPLAVCRTLSRTLHGTRFNWIHSVAAIMALGQQALARRRQSRALF